MPYYFARLVGVNSGTFDVSATAVGAPPNSYNPPGGGGVTNMMPIGLDYTTGYESGQPITLAEKFSAGPGNWGFLAIGGNGDRVLVNNIQNGVQAPLSTYSSGDTTSSAPTAFVATEPGVGNGFKAMDEYHYTACASVSLTTALNSYGTYSSCFVCIPLVDWAYDSSTGSLSGGSCTGKCTVPIMSFASFYVTGVTAHGASSTITATWSPTTTCEGGAFTPGSSPGTFQGAVAIQLIK